MTASIHTNLRYPDLPAQPNIVARFCDGRNEYGECWSSFTIERGDDQFSLFSPHVLRPAEVACYLRDLRREINRRLLAAERAAVRAAREDGELQAALGAYHE